MKLCKLGERCRFQWLTESWGYEEVIHFYYFAFSSLFLTAPKQQERGGQGGGLKVSGSHTRPAESGSPALGPSDGSLFLTNLPGHFYACGCGATLWGTSLQEFYAVVFRILVSSLAYEDRSICRVLGAERKQSMPLWTHYTEIAGVVHKQNPPGTRRKGWRGSLRGPPPRASPLGRRISSCSTRLSITFPEGRESASNGD